MEAFIYIYIYIYIYVHVYIYIYIINIVERMQPMQIMVRQWLFSAVRMGMYAYVSACSYYLLRAWIHSFIAGQGIHWVNSYIHEHTRVSSCTCVNSYVNDFMRAAFWLVECESAMMNAYTYTYTYTFTRFVHHTCAPHRSRSRMRSLALFSPACHSDAHKILHEHYRHAHRTKYEQDEPDSR